MSNAAMAQLVEHILGKDEVPSSNLGSSSRKDTRECVFSFCISIRLPQVLNLRELQSVKEHVQQGADKRAAGELEGARPASNTINRRPKVLIHQRLLEQSSILIISKCSADEACQKKSSQDFFDKLRDLVSNETRSFYEVKAS